MAQLILTFLFLFFQATQRRRLYPSIDRFKKECDLYMGVIKATPRMLDSYEEKESSELSAEKRGMCDAAARLGLNNVENPLYIRRAVVNVTVVDVQNNQPVLPKATQIRQPVARGREQAMNQKRRSGLRLIKGPKADHYWIMAG